MSLDPNILFNYRTMLGYLLQNPVAKRFLTKTFFNRNDTFFTEKVDIDIQKNKRRAAGFVHPTATANTVEREGYKTESVAPGYIKEMIPTTVAQLLKRAPGETIYDAVDPARRAAELYSGDLSELAVRLERRKELMAAEALLTGKVRVKGKGFDHEVDYHYEDGVHVKILSSSSMWDAPTAKPLEDLDTSRREVSERSGLVPRICIMGRKASWAFLRNPEVKEMLDNRRIELGKIDPKDLDEGVTYIATVKPAMVDVYTYDEVYWDDGQGKNVSLIPDDVVLLGSPQAYTSMLYGAIQNIYGLGASTVFPHSWIEPNGSARYVQLESAPLPNFAQVDAFQVLHVV